MIKTKFIGLASRASILWRRSMSSTLSPTCYHHEASSSFRDLWIALFISVSYFSSLLLQSPLLSLFLLFLSPVSPLLPLPPLGLSTPPWTGALFSRSLPSHFQVYGSCFYHLFGIHMNYLVLLTNLTGIETDLYCHLFFFSCFISILEAIGFSQIHELLFS